MASWLLCLQGSQPEQEEQGKRNGAIRVTAPTLKPDCLLEIEMLSPLSYQQFRFCDALFGKLASSLCPQPLITW
jgi:hypothetical protein